jgi:hypothetical protein
MSTTELRYAANEAKAAGNFRKAAAILAVLADVLGEKPGKSRTSPTWRECYSCNARA